MRLTFGQVGELYWMGVRLWVFRARAFLLDGSGSTASGATGAGAETDMGTSFPRRGDYAYGTPAGKCFCDHGELMI
jgi:hypothetical protein